MANLAYGVGSAFNGIPRAQILSRFKHIRQRYIQFDLITRTRFGETDALEGKQNLDRTPLGPRGITDRRETRGARLMPTNHNRWHRVHYGEWLALVRFTSQRHRSLGSALE